MTDHVDVDELADLLAGLPAEAGPGSTHVAGCPRCADQLADLRAADSAVRAQLAQLPDPPLPADLAARISAALAAEAAGSDAGTEPPADVATAATLSTLPARPVAGATTRWLSMAAAAVLLLGGVAFGISQVGSDDADSQTSAASDEAATDAGGSVVRNDTGRNYTGRTDLAAAVPGLLAGNAADLTMQAPAAGGTSVQSDARATTESASSAPPAAFAADPLSRLRSDAGLAECLLALLPPEDESVQPLALDYGSFNATPALVVVLPSALPDKLDVFVVGAGCSRANDSLLFYTSVDSS